MTPRLFRALVLLLPLALGLAAVPALSENGGQGYPTNSQVTGSGYNPDAQTSKTYPFVPATSTASTTTLSLANIALLPRFKVNGRPNLSISARFSSSSGTCAVRYVALYQASSSAPLNVLGVSPITTITLDLVPPTDPAGLYMAPNVLQDSYGASDGVLLLVYAPSAGTVTLGMGSY